MGIFYLKYLFNRHLSILVIGQVLLKCNCRGHTDNNAKFLRGAELHQEKYANRLGFLPISKGCEEVS